MPKLNACRQRAAVHLVIEVEEGKQRAAIAGGDFDLRRAALIANQCRRQRLAPKASAQREDARAPAAALQFQIDIGEDLLAMSGDDRRLEIQIEIVEGQRRLRAAGASRSAIRRRRAIEHGAQDGTRVEICRAHHEFQRVACARRLETRVVARRQFHLSHFRAHEMRLRGVRSITPASCEPPASNKNLIERISVRALRQHHRRLAGAACRLHQARQEDCRYWLWKDRARFAHRRRPSATAF